MTPEDERVIMSLVVVPGRPHTDTRDDVLRHFGAANGQDLGLALLRDAVSRRDGDDVELALIVCSTFGFGPDHLGPLLELLPADWHVTHEDVVSALGELRAPAAVDALTVAAQWVPKYLEFDDNRALATKAIWALGRTPGPEAEQALSRLRDSDNDIVRRGAEAQLARRSS